MTARKRLRTIISIKIDKNSLLEIFVWSAIYRRVCYVLVGSIALHCQDKTRRNVIKIRI